MNFSLQNYSFFKISSFILIQITIPIPSKNLVVLPTILKKIFTKVTFDHFLKCHTIFDCDLVGQLVGQLVSYRYFSKTAPRISLIFCMEVHYYEGKKRARPFFREKSGFSKMGTYVVFQGSFGPKWAQQQGYFHNTRKRLQGFS